MSHTVPGSIEPDISLLYSPYFPNIDFDIILISYFRSPSFSPPLTFLTKPVSFVFTQHGVCAVVV